MLRQHSSSWQQLCLHRQLTTFWNKAHVRFTKEKCPSLGSAHTTNHHQTSVNLAKSVTSGWVTQAL